VTTKTKFNKIDTSSSGQDCVNGGNAVGRSLNLDEVVGLHQAGRCHEEGGVGHSSEI